MKIIITDHSKLPQEFPKYLGQFLLLIERFIVFSKDKYRVRHEGHTYFARDQIIDSNKILTRYFVDEIGIKSLKERGFIEVIQPFRFKKDATQFFKLNYSAFKKYGLQIWPPPQNNFFFEGDSESAEPNTIELERLTSKDHNVLKKQCKQNAKKAIKDKKIRSSSVQKQKPQDIPNEEQRNFVREFDQENDNSPAPRECSFTQEKSTRRSKSRGDKNSSGNGKIAQDSGRVSSSDQRARNYRENRQGDEANSNSIRLQTSERRFDRDRLRSLILEKLNYSANDIELSCLLRFEYSNIIDAIAIAIKQTKKKTIKSIPAYLTGILKRWRNQVITIDSVAQTESMEQYFKRMEQKDNEINQMFEGTTKIDFSRLKFSKVT